MKIKLFICLCTVFFLTLLLGCSTSDNHLNDFEEDESKVTDEKTTEKNELLTEKVENEEGVLAGQVYTQENIAIGTLLLDKSVSDEDAKKLAEKYAKEIKEEYQDMKVNVQAVRDGENVANITLE